MASTRDRWLKACIGETQADSKGYATLINAVRKMTTMRKSTLAVGAMAVSFLIVTSGCATYKAGTLPVLQPEFAAYSDSKDGVTINVNALTTADSQRIFDRDILAKGYQPIQITIDNDSDKYILFSAQGIGLPVATPQEVADKVHTSTVGRAAAYGVAGLIVWPFLIPAVVDGVGSSQANEKLDRDFAEKAVGQVVIQPYAKHNGVVFVQKEEYQDSFVVTPVERATKRKLTFRVAGI